MREQLEERLKALEAEFQSGQKVLAELQARQLEVRGTLLRISGAIQVLRELLPKPDSDGPPAGRPQEREKDLVAAR